METDLFKKNENGKNIKSRWFKETHSIFVVTKITEPENQKNKLVWVFQLICKCKCFSNISILSLLNLCRVTELNKHNN